ncbi:MAG: HIRAN domain-containing protein [Gammaproteobacteria bacterium]|nr:HIRAN domain-containing protein [Gammaproteobacteria bacterium]
MNHSKRFFMQLLTGTLITPVIGATSTHATPPSRYQELLLNRFSIAGFIYYDGPLLKDEQLLSLGTALKLRANPRNPFDRFAVEIYFQEQLIGHVPRSDNRHIHRMLAQGIQLKCKVIAPHPDSSLFSISAGVFLPAALSS